MELWEGKTLSEDVSFNLWANLVSLLAKLPKDDGFMVVINEAIAESYPIWNINLLPDDSALDWDTLFYSDIAKTIVSVISILGIISYNEIALTLAPVQTTLAFGNLLDIVNWAYANILKLIQTN